jgi:hypothetical protein
MATNSGVYEIVNLRNGKRYIGSDAIFSERFAEHRVLRLIAERRLDVPVPHWMSSIKTWCSLEEKLVAGGDL